MQNTQRFNFPQWITLCFHALFLLTPFLFTWVNSELFEINKMFLVYAMTIVVGALWALRMIFEKRVIWTNQPIAWLAVAFLVGQALSTIFSIHLRTSFLGYYSRLNGGLLSSLSYVVLLLALINNVPKKQALPLLLTNILAAALASLYALPEKLGASPSCYLMNQEWNTTCWKQDVQERAFGTFGQPNWLAMYLAGLLPAIVFFAQKQKETLRKIWIGAGALVLITIIFTKSRSGLVAVGVMAGLWALFQFQPIWWRALKKALRARWQRIAVGVGALALLIIIGVLGSRLIPTSEESFDLSQGTESGSIRLIVWQGAVKVWQRYPWFGSGPGTFGYSYYQDRPAEHNLVSEWDNLYNKAHNEFLNYLAETGLLGVVGFLAFFVGAAWLLVQKMGKNPQKTTLAKTALLSLAGLAVTYFFGFSTVTSNLLFFLLPALVFLEESEIYTPSKKRLRWQKPAIAATLILGAFLLTRVIRSWEADWYYAQGKRLEAGLDYAGALVSLQKATEIVPKEPIYYDELANLYAKLALAYYLDEEASTGDQLAEAALQNSDYALLLNPRHLVLYKTRIRVLFLLAQADRQYFGEAEKALKAAIALSPTDAQLWYNLGMAQQEMGKFEEAVKTFQRTVELKTNYVRARSVLGDLLVQLGRVEEGKTQYRFILENLSSTDEEVRGKLHSLEAPQSE